MSFHVSKTLGPSGPPDHNRRSIELIRTDAPPGQFSRTIVEMTSIDPDAGWGAREDLIVTTICDLLRSEWPELAE